MGADAATAKASFDDVYNQLDPRAYYRALKPLDYRSPDVAQPIFRQCVESLREIRDTDRVTVLDLCCGYGVNAALLNHDVTLDELYARYASDSFGLLSPEEVVERDRAFFRTRRKTRRARVLGLDVAGEAVRYARSTELIDAGFTADLERGAPGPAMAEALEKVDLVTVTGGLSYIGDASIRRILGAVPRSRPRPWVALFPLRITDFGGVRGALQSAGLRIEGYRRRTFRQRRFRDRGERQRVLQRLRHLGFDPAGKESNGYIHATFQLARPQDEAASAPLDELMHDARPLEAGGDGARAAI